MIVLKIIGIVLLIIIALILISIFLVLFVPIRYSIKARYEDKPIGELKITWFFKFINIVVRYKEEVVISIKIFGFKLLQKKTKNLSNKANVSKLIENNDIMAFNEYDISDNVIDKKTIINNTLNNKLENNEAQDMLADAEKPKQKFKNKINNFYKKLKAVYIKLINKVRIFKENITDKLTYITELVDKYYTNENISLVSYTYELSKKLLVHVLPQKTKVMGVIGLDNPELTAYIFGFMSIVDGPKIELDLKPEFNSKIIRIMGSARGRVYIFYIVFKFIRLYFDKRTKKLIANIKKG